VTISFSEDETGNIQPLNIYLFSLCASFQNSAKVHENNNLRQQEEKAAAALNPRGVLLAALSESELNPIAEQRVPHCYQPTKQLWCEHRFLVTLVEYIRCLLFGLIDRTCIFIFSYLI